MTSYLRWFLFTERLQECDPVYKLTLTREERKAIDFVGHCYSNGTDLYDLLCDPGVKWSDESEGDEWEKEGDLTFNIPEHIAWQILENRNQEDGFWPLFSDELAAKMEAFCNQIV